MNMPISEDDRFTLRGRSIDGDVWWTGGGWGPRNRAKLMSWEEACEAQDQARVRNKGVEPDAMVGRLVID